jgi:hypothetical protein
LRKQPTAKLVWAARKRYCTKPSIRTAAAYQRIRRAYEDRFPKRRLDHFNHRVEILPYEVQ